MFSLGCFTAIADPKSYSNVVLLSILTPKSNQNMPFRHQRLGQRFKNMSCILVNISFNTVISQGNRLWLVPKPESFETVIMKLFKCKSGQWLVPRRASLDETPDRERPTLMTSSEWNHFRRYWNQDWKELIVYLCDLNGFLSLVD